MILPAVLHELLVTLGKRTASTSRPAGVIIFLKSLQGKLPAVAFSGPNDTSFRLIYRSLQITPNSLFKQL